MLNILIADDHQIVREGLKQLLLEEFVFIHLDEAENATALVQKCNETVWDIVISDLSMPGGGAFAALEALKEKLPALPVLILSIYPEEQYALRALRAGASGYLNKDAAGEELIKAVYHILSGKKYMSEKIAGLYHTLADDKLLHETLSERELAVFRFIALGIPITDIAAALSVNASTVSTYRSRILDKMKMRSNAEITKYAIENKII